MMTMMESRTGKVQIVKFVNHLLFKTNLYNFAVAYSKSYFPLFVLVDDDDDGDGILDKDEVDGAYHIMLFFSQEMSNTS